LPDNPQRNEIDAQAVRRKCTDGPSLFVEPHALSGLQPLGALLDQAANHLTKKLFAIENHFATEPAGIGNG
jgi:hypothetical protein